MEEENIVSGKNFRNMCKRIVMTKTCLEKMFFRICLVTLTLKTNIISSVELIYPECVLLLLLPVTITCLARVPLLVYVILDKIRLIKQTKYLHK